MPKQSKNFIPGNHQKVQEAFMQCINNNKNKKKVKIKIEDENWKLKLEMKIESKFRMKIANKN